MSTPSSRSRRRAQSRPASWTWRATWARPTCAPGAAPAARAFAPPYGLVSPVQQLAVLPRRYMHEYGATSEQFAQVAVSQRRNASRNPRAFFREPITVEDGLNSRMIADPLHLLDCSLETDGACALIVTSAERAPALKQPPAHIS